MNLLDDDLEREKNAIIAAILVWIGAIWFFFDMIMLPPLCLILSSLNLPDNLYKILFIAEFPLSATLAIMSFRRWRHYRRSKI